MFKACTFVYVSRGWLTMLFLELYNEKEDKSGEVENRIVQN